MGRYPFTISVEFPRAKPPLELLGLVNFDRNCITEHFHLSAAGRLTLQKYSFWYFKKKIDPQIVNYEFAGDFEVSFGHLLGGSRINIPFRDGKIDHRTNRWKTTTNLINGIIKRECAGGMFSRLDF